MRSLPQLAAALLLSLPVSGAAAPLSDARARAALAALEGASRAEARAALDEVLAAGDLRFAAPLIELLRASEVGVAGPATGPVVAQGLEALTGQAFGTRWPDWVRWYAGTDLQAPPGFTGFKGRLLGRIDPAFAALLRDDHPRRIRSEEIVWGGVAFEGIPALDDPLHVEAAQASYLGDAEPVFGVALGGAARAYPQRILDWHELANDRLGGVAFSLAWCTLCGAGIVYDARVAGVGELRFGSSGLLLASNKLMVDRATRTLWSQLTGRPVLGPLADRDLQLRVLPSVVTTWGAWRRLHPHTTVLSLDTGHDRPYSLGAAYAGYFASPDTLFPVPRTRTELPAKARVFALEQAGRARAFALDALLARDVLNDAVGDTPVVLVARAPAIEVDGHGLRSGPVRYPAGAAVRAYERGAHRFVAGDTPETLRDARGRAWRVSEDALLGPDGQRLPRRAGVLAYWFAWTRFHPRTQLWSGDAQAGD